MLAAMMTVRLLSGLTACLQPRQPFCRAHSFKINLSVKRSSVAVRYTEMALIFRCGIMFTLPVQQEQRMP